MLKIGILFSQLRQLPFECGFAGASALFSIWNADECLSKKMALSDAVKTVVEMKQDPIMLCAKLVAPLTNNNHQITQLHSKFTRARRSVTQFSCFPITVRFLPTPSPIARVLSQFLGVTWFFTVAEISDGIKYPARMVFVGLTMVPSVQIAPFHSPSMKPNICH